MTGGNTSDPVHESLESDVLPGTAALRRWQDFYAFLVADTTKWAGTRALLHAIPEMLPDALLVLDAAGSVVLVNSQLELMFGYHRSELMGKAPEMLLPPELRGQHVRLRQDYVDAPRARRMGEAKSFRAHRKNGTELHVHVMLGPVATPDGVCIIAVIRRADASDHDGGYAGESD